MKRILALLPLALIGGCSTIGEAATPQAPSTALTPATATTTAGVTSATPTTASPSPSPTLTVSPLPTAGGALATPTIPADVAPEWAKAVEAAIFYMQEVDKLDRDHTSDYQSIYYLVSELEWKNQVASLEDLRRRHLTWVGDIDFKITGVGVPHVKGTDTYLDVYACTDARKIQFVNSATSMPTTDAGAIDQVLDWTFTMALSDGVWYVSDSSNTKANSCPG